MASKHKVSVAEVISEALVLFGAKGEHWISGMLQDGHENYCAIGGLNAAGRKLHAPAGVVAAAKHAVAQEIKPNVPKSRAQNEIIGYNDSGSDGWSGWGDQSVFNLKHHTGFKRVKAKFCAALKKNLSTSKARKKK